MTEQAALVLPGERLRELQGSMAGTLVERQFAAHPELAARYGPSGRLKCLEDANYHLSFLADAMNVGNPALFANYVAWAKVMLGKRGIGAQDLAQYLESTRTVVGERLGGAPGALAQAYLNSALASLPALPIDIASWLDADTPLAAMARGYLAALLEGERRKASVMILDAVAAGTPVKDLYLHVFQPVQYEVGRLWQVNRISVAQEHYCTAATQLVMSQLYPYTFAAEHSGGTLVATCVAGDLHEIGVRMVADFFEMDGWNTFYLGASTPAVAVVEALVKHGADVLAISVTMAAHLRAAADLIARVRAAAGCESVRVLVGGSLLIVHPELRQTLGADGCAADAQQAIVTANRLVAGDGR